VDDGCIQEKIRASEYALEKRGENQSKAWKHLKRSLWPLGEPGQVGGDSHLSMNIGH
jgi:hypothetical protein